MPDFDRASVYALMPPLQRAYFFTAVLARVQNAADSKAIAAWVALSGAIVAAAGGMLSFFWVAATSRTVSDFARFHPKAMLAFGGSCATLVIVGLIWIIKRRREQSALRRADTLSNFTILQMVTLCHVRSAERLDFYHRYWLKVLQPGVQKFEMDFNWSSDLETLSVSIRDPRLTWKIVPTSRIGVRRLVIDLPEDMAAGHREVVEFAFVTNTAGRPRAVPFVSLSAPSNKFPRFNTYLMALFEEAVRPARLYRERFFSALIERPIRRDVVQLNSNNYHLWPLDVRPGWRSSLRWVYSGDEHGS